MLGHLALGHPGAVSQIALCQTSAFTQADKLLGEPLVSLRMQGGYRFSHFPVDLRLES